MAEALVQLWIAVLVAMVPRAPVARLDPIARAVLAVAARDGDRATLVAISLHETGLGRAGVPFGLSCCWRLGMPLAEVARRALAIVQRCPRSVGDGLGLYHHGNRCRPDRYARHELRTRASVLVHLARERRRRRMAAP